MARGEAKLITHGDPAREKILAGAKILYEAVAATYGATSGNVAILRNYGYPTITHDGVSVAREVFRANGAEDVGVALLEQASRKTNDTAGDGTSATVILGYHILAKAHRAQAAGANPMALRRGIEKAATTIINDLEKLATPVKPEELPKIAAISAGDPEVGKLVADTVVKVGGVGITVEKYEGMGVIQDVVDGLYFEKGWSMPHFVTDRVAEEAVHDNVSVVVLEKKITQNQDIVPIIELVYKDTEHKTLLIVGNVDGQALETCALTNMHGKVKICAVKPPVYGDQELPFLEDIAVMTGAQLVNSSFASDKVTKEMLGFAKKIIVAKDSTTIFDGQGAKEDIEVRIATLTDQLNDDKYSAFQRERMEFRMAKLKGKIGIIKVGGATEAEQEELKFRVEDAVHATRAANEDGIVPGGGTTLARLSAITDTPPLTEDEAIGYQVVLEALAEPFKQLMTNAGEEGEYRLRQLLKSQPGYGFDVTKMAEDPVDLNKAGVVDPARVIAAVVENACSAAKTLITIPTVIDIDRSWQLEQIELNKGMQSQ